MDNMPFPAAFIDDIPQICVLCGIYFNNALSLQYHMRLHAAPQDTTLFDARPPPVLPNPIPTTTSSPTNGSLNSSVSSNISPVTPNSTTPKQDFELGLEFLNSLTQMYANPSASREIKEKGYDFRYEPTTSNQSSSGAQDITKPTETLKYNFDDIYNSPGAEELDKKFESVLNFELSKDNGMHFDNHKEPLESILDDEPLSDKEKAEKLVDSVSQMYQNELRNELDSISNDSKLDSISNDSIKPDEQNKMTNLKIPNLPESPKCVKDTEHSNHAKAQTVSQPVSLPVPQENNQVEDPQSFEDEIPKVGKFMKIKKYFQSQEMRKKEISSVEKSETPTNVMQNGEKTDKVKETVNVVKIVDPVIKKTENVAIANTEKSSAPKETKKTVVKGKVEKSNTAKEDKKDTSDKEEIGISVRSLRRRPNKAQEPVQKKQNPRKKANPKKVIRKDQIEEMVKELDKQTNQEKNAIAEEKKDNPKKEQEKETGLEIKESETEKKEKEEPQIESANVVSEVTDVKNQNAMNTECAETEKENSPDKDMAPEVKSDIVPVVTAEEKKDSESKEIFEHAETETQNEPINIETTKHIIEEPIKSDSETTENEDSEGLGFYGQETVEPLKIKIWKIKRHKKKKHKKKKRKKYRMDRSSTESLSLTEYTELTDFASAEITNTRKEKQKHKKAKRFHEKKHACEFCGQGFGQRSDLRKHIMIHTGERPWVCETCEKTFQRKTDLVKHTRIHTGEKPYECEYCGKKVSDKSQLNVHRRLHTGDRPYTCDICSKGCITSSELTRHRQSHFTDRPWKCEVCEKAFKLKECLAMHMKIHNGTKKYQCAKCGLGFDRESKMERHMFLHETENPYVCRECGLEFDNSSHYAGHVRSHKSEHQGPWSCDYCGRLYEYKSNMETHQRTHIGDKPFICELCNSSYSLKGNLKHHMKVQHSDLSYKCHVCGQTFHLKRDLVNHSRTHPEDQLHCFYCDSHFWDQEAAIKHHTECSARKDEEMESTDNPAMSSILDKIDDEFAKSFTPQGKIESPPPTRDKKELDKIYEFDDSDSETKPKRAKVKPASRKDVHSHASPRNRDSHMSPRNKDLHMSPRNKDHLSPKGPSFSPKGTHFSPKGISPKGSKRSRDPETSKALTITALLNSPPMNKKQKPIPQPKSEKVDLFQGILDTRKSAVLSNTVKDDDLDLLHRQIGANVSDTLPNLTVSDKTDLFENIIESTDLSQSKENASVPFTTSLSSTTESSVFSSKDTIDSLLSSAPVLGEQPSNLPEQHSDLPVTSNTNSSTEDRNFAPSYNWKNDLMPSMDYVNSLLMKSLNGPSSSSMTSGDADDSLSKFNLDYLNPLIMKTLNPDLKFDTNENLHKSNSFYTASTQSSNIFSPPSTGLPSSNVFSPTSVPSASVFSPTTLPSGSNFSPTSLPSVSVFSPTSVASASIFTTTATPSSNVFSPPIGSYSYKPQFSSPSDTRVDTFTTTDYTSSLSRTLGMPNIEKLAMDYLYQSSVAGEKEFQQKFGLTGKADASVPLPSFNYLNTMATNQDMLHDPLDMSAFAGLPSMSAFTRNPDFNAHLAAPLAYGTLDISKTLPSGEKVDDTAALLSNFEYGT